MTQVPRNALVPVYILLCLLLGGSSQGVWRELLLQLLGLGLIAWASWEAAKQGSEGRPQTFLTALAAGAIGLIILQMLPLPPALWTALPGRDVVVHGFDLLGAPRPWLPLSLSPFDGVSAALALVPPVAILAGMLHARAYRADWCAAAVLAAALIGIVLATFQATTGSPHLYPIHNVGGAAGLFANSNHMASLLVASIPFLAALAGSAYERKEWINRLAPALAGLLLVGIGLAVSGSLAGAALAGPVAVSSAVLVVPSFWYRRTRLVVGAWIAAALTAVLGFHLASEPATTEASITTRQEIAQRTWQALADFMPVGSGLGSFERVYPMYEDSTLVSRWYVNHAHNDYLELALEMGLPGLVLLGAFLWWWARQVIKLWQAPVANRLAVAAAIASAALLLHSAVDYPLRTSALAAVFAMCVGFMAEWKFAGRKESKPLGRSRHLTLEGGTSA